MYILYGCYDSSYQTEVTQRNEWNETVWQKEHLRDDDCYTVYTGVSYLFKRFYKEMMWSILSTEL